MVIWRSSEPARTVAKASRSGNPGQGPGGNCAFTFALACCTVAVYRGAGIFVMIVKKQIPAKLKSAAQPRASVTFPPELYRNLEHLAKKKKVSIAWVVREAAEKYVEDQWPLFGGTLLGEKR